MLHVVFAWSLAQVPEPPVPADEIRWVAPPGCPGRADLISGVERRRGQPLVPGQARVDATVTAGPGRRFTLEISLAVGAREDRRTLTADRCGALVDAAALLLAVAIDEQSASAPAPEPAPPAPDEPAPAPQAEPPLSDEPAPAPVVTPSEPTPAPVATPLARRRVGGFVRAHGGLEYGAVPGATGAVGLGLGVLWKRARLELQPVFVAPRTVTSAGVEVEALLFAVAAVGCGRLGRGSLEVPLCGGLEGGVMRGISRGPDGSRTAVGEWFAVLASAGVVWRFDRRFGLWAAVQGVGALRRPRYVLRDPGDEVLLFKPAPVSLRVLVGLELRFGDPR